MSILDIIFLVLHTSLLLKCLEWVGSFIGLVCVCMWGTAYFFYQRSNTFKYLTSEMRHCTSISAHHDQFSWRVPDSSQALACMAVVLGVPAERLAFCFHSLQGFHFTAMCGTVQVDNNKIMPQHYDCFWPLSLYLFTQAMFCAVQPSVLFPSTGVCWQHCISELHWRQTSFEPGWLQVTFPLPHCPPVSHQ